jgi:hypothetical protein
MLSWVVRAIMFAAAIIAGWFVARDAVNFGVIQLVAALFLITAFVAVAAFWEALAERLKSKRTG